MKKQTSIALAAAILLAGVSVAAAADGPSPAANASMKAASASMKMAPPASGTLSLTSAQRKTAWNDLYVKSLNQPTPSGFHAIVGAVVPKSIATAPMTKKAASDVPALKPYRFTMLQKELVIVNPSDKKIAEVITR